MPSTCVTAGINFVFYFLILKTFIMNCTSSFFSNQFFTCSLNIDGANGLKLSLFFILMFSNSFIFGFLGSAIIDLFLGPRSPFHFSLKPSYNLSFEIFFATIFVISLSFEKMISQLLSKNNSLWFSISFLTSHY